MPQQPALVAADISKRFNGHTAVSGYSLTLNRGDVLGLLGPNGAGKTTTLAMLSGMLAPDSGHVALTGMSLVEDPVNARRRLGYLPDQPPLYPELRVREYLDYAARLRKIPGRDIDMAIKRSLERCGLPEVQNRLIGQLSTGYRQRLGIAQAIIHEPEVVILDEPTTGLDPAQLSAMRDLIHELGRDHAVILSSHILNEVEASCNRVQIINEGRLVYEQPLNAPGEDNRAISICLARSPGTEALEHIPGVRSAVQTGEYCFELITEEAPDSNVIAAYILEQGWGLRSMMPSLDTLEHIFMQTVFKEQQ